MSNAAVELKWLSNSWSDDPVVVVCIDGRDLEYLEHDVQPGIIPNMPLMIFLKSYNNSIGGF